MNIKITLPICILLFASIACGTTTSGAPPLAPLQPAAPFQPSATPYIADSYPTAEAESVSAMQNASGIDFHMERAWQEGKQVNTEVCFNLPDASDWMIWDASLKYGEIELLEYGTTLSRFEEGQPAIRCDVLEFYVPPDADLTLATVSIKKIGAFPQQEDYCTIYMPKIQQVLNERGAGIQLACNEVNGILSMQIVSKPETMSQEEAEQIVFSDEFFTIPGPWDFNFSLGQ
jgi:hypothetical protein